MLFFASSLESDSDSDSGIEEKEDDDDDDMNESDGFTRILLSVLNSDSICRFFSLETDICRALFFSPCMVF